MESAPVERLANISLSEGESVKTDDSVTKDDDLENRDKFLALVKKSRQLAESGEVGRALRLNRKALALHYNEKLERRIQKMEAFLADQDNSSDDDENMEEIANGFKLHCSLARKLYTHQRDGVLWLYSLFRKGKGGILADDMGLGKTIQVIAFLSGMFDMDHIKTVMIVVPLSVMPNWVAEFSKWTPGITVTQFYDSKKERERALHKVRSRGGVMLTTYGLIITQKETLAERFGREFVWDYVILDEGHKIKNTTKTSKGVHAIPAKNRIILTGTPVQNNLKELWSLFDYVHQGSLLGTVRTFKMQFETPITRARERDASAVQKRLGQEMSDALKSIIQPYFLRRTKKEVSDQKEETQDERCAKMPELTRKNDIVLWVHLTEMQEKIYRDFGDLDEVKALLMTKKSPLVALTVLKKVCDHPRLLSTRACMKLGLDGDDFDEEDLESHGLYESAVTQIGRIPDDVLIGESGKMGILVELLDNFRQGGHKTLVFSQSRKLLDIIQKVITNRGHKVARIDGQVTNMSEREDIVQKFQKDPSYSVFLLTIQVGGVGLTITAADRVIIYDPSWNPAVDAQAVDRAYRIGQTENVVVHRLITCSTVEEKIYRRQVFKDSITKQTTGNAKNPYRYFTKVELKELFTLDDPKFSKTQRQLQEMHSNQRVTDEALDMHIAFLYSMDIFGISDHDLMFSQTHVRDDEEDDDRVGIGPQESNNNEQFIQYKIQQAQMLIAEESNNVLSYEQRSKGGMRFDFGSRSRPDDGPGPFQQPQSSLFSQIPPLPLERDVIELSDDENGDEVRITDGPSSPLSIERVHIQDSDGSDTEMKPNVHHEHQNHSNELLDVKLEQNVDIKPTVKQEEHMNSDSFDIKHEQNIDIKPEPCNETGDNKVFIKHEDDDMKCSSENRAGSNREEDSHTRNMNKSLEEDPDIIEIFEEEENEICDIISDKVNRNASNASDESDIETTDKEQSDDSSSDMESKKKGPLSLSISRSEESRSDTHKRALQPLTQADVDKRSPMTALAMDRRRIISEEIEISPDCSRPLIGLETSKSKDRQGGKLSSTPAQNFSSRMLKFSALQSSPMEVGASPSVVGCSPQVSKTRVNLHKTFFEASTPNDVNMSASSHHGDVLAADSPDSVSRPMSSMENSPSLSLDSSKACRSLSFGTGPQSDKFSNSETEGIVDESRSESVVDESSDETHEDVAEQEDDAVEEEDEEEEDLDDESNARFQDLIMVARALYKSKEYSQSLVYVEEALTIFEEPGLQDMAQKIRSKLELQNTE